MLVESVRESLLHIESMEMGLFAIHNNEITWSNNEKWKSWEVNMQAGMFNCELSLPS